MNSSSAGAAASRMPTAELWRHYRATGNPDTRGQLLELYIGLVYHVAREIGGRTDAVELDEMVSAGTFGLVRALDGFDVSRGLAFSTYAVRWIRRAILDDLRSQDWAPRAVRVKARRLRVATVALGMRLGRIPQPEEVAAQLDIDITTYRRWCDETATLPAASCEGEPCGGADRAEELGRPEGARVLRDAIARLPEKERAVMALRYYEALNQRQVAQVMHLSEARVLQILAKALKRLRERLAAAGTEQELLPEKAVRERYATPQQLLTGSRPRRPDSSGATPAG